MRHFITVFALSTYASSVSATVFRPAAPAAPAAPKPAAPAAPAAPKPAAPVAPKPASPNSPKPGGLPIDEPDDPIGGGDPWEQIHTNMGRLEQNLEANAVGGDVAQQVVEAILRPSQETEMPTSTLAVTFTPTITVPTSSFAACTSYADILSRCESQTSAFYSLAPSIQASCACYQTQTMAVYESCGPSSERGVVYPTLAASRFDNVANTCHDFFDLQGYKNGAKALSGKSGNQTVLGAGFCANLGREANLKANTTKGLPEKLEPSVVQGCRSTSPAVMGSGAPMAGLTTFDRAIFVTVPLVVFAFSFLLFG